MNAFDSILRVGSGTHNIPAATSQDFAVSTPLRHFKYGNAGTTCGKPTCRYACLCWYSWVSGAQLIVTHCAVINASNAITVFNYKLNYEALTAGNTQRGIQT